MNTVVNQKSKDNSRDLSAEKHKRLGKTWTHSNSGSKKRLLGVVSGASNRGTPRGARAQERTNLAMTPTSATSKERFRLSSDEPNNTALKVAFDYFAGTNASTIQRAGYLLRRPSAYNWLKTTLGSIQRCCKPAASFAE